MQARNGAQRRRPNHPPADGAAPRPPSRALPMLAAAFAIGTIVLTAVESPVALTYVFTEGLPVLAIIAAATLPGCGVMHVLRASDPSPMCRGIFGAGLALGLLGPLELLLGVVGRLDRTSWVEAFAVLVVLGVVLLRRSLLRLLSSEITITPPPLLRAHAWLLVLVPFVAVLLVAATAPPGILWREEGFGYDVLEYHLAVPREFFDAGRITYLPHNVYSNFPMNAEMLYLLAMVLKGDPFEAAVFANMFNAAAALLTIVAAWAAARPFGQRAAALAAILIGSCGWLVYLSGLAYVENLMLLFTTLALGAGLRAVHNRTEPSDAPAASRVPWALAAGVFAGLACGCKYTAIVLVAFPIGVLLLIGVRQSLRNMLIAVGVYSAGVLVAFAPWLAKNAVLCGDPVFPLASATIGHYPPGWDADSAARWNEGHRPPAHARSLVGRASAIAYEVLAEPRVGPLLWILGGVAVVLGGRHRRTLAAILVVQIVLWATLTHLVGRFAVPIVPVLVLLAASGMQRVHARAAIVLWCGVVLTVGASLYHTGRLYYDQTRVPTESGYEERLPLSWSVDWFLGGQWPGTEYLAYLNRTLPPTSRILLVADARSFYVQRPHDYCVVFNANPLAEAARAPATPADVVAWLRRSGYTHVYVNWLEMDRLRRTYGFWPEIPSQVFEAMRDHGLRRLRDFRLGPGGAPYATIYEVVP